MEGGRGVWGNGMLWRAMLLVMTFVTGYGETINITRYLINVSLIIA